MFGLALCIVCREKLANAYTRKKFAVLFCFLFCKTRQRLGLFSLFVVAAMRRICNERGGMRGNHHRLPAQVLAQVLGTDYTYVTPTGELVTFGADYHNDCCTVKRPARSNSPPSVISIGRLHLLCSFSLSPSTVCDSEFLFHLSWKV